MKIPNLGETITWEALAALLSVLGVAGAVALWLLGQRFATRAQLAKMHLKIEEERRQTDAAIGFHDKRVTEIEQQLKLAAQAALQVGNDIKEIKSMLAERLLKNEERVARHGERLAAIEGESRRH